jgi:DNA mismatch repair ATPase MutL
VNVTPDKRKVFLHAEQRIMAAFQQGLQALWEPSRNTYDVQDTLGVTQQALRGGSGSGRAAVAAGARSIPLQSFSQFSRASPVGVAGAAGASPGAKRLQHQQQGGDGEEEGGEEVHEQEQGSPAEPSCEPPSKRRAVLPLAAFALGVGSQQTAAGPDSQDQAMQEQQEQQQEQAVGKQRSLLSFGFLQSKPEPGGREHSSRGQLECQHPQQHPQQQDLEEGFEGDGGGGAEGSGRSLNALRQPAATAAVLETTPVVVAADEDAQQRQQQQQQQWDQGQGGGGGAGDSEGDDMYELSDAEAGERGGAQPEEPAAAGQANAAVAEPAAGEGAAAAAAVAGAAEAGGATQAANTGGDITAAVDLAGMRRRLLAAARSSATAAAAQQAGRRRRSQFAAASLASGSGGAGEAGLSREQAEAVAEQELARVFDKADFLRLEVVGQFNLGFILARLDRDLFIIDQHASGGWLDCCSLGLIGK